MTETAEDIVRYRLERAGEALEDARLLAGVGHWNSCVNRLYYSCFYAVEALLVRHGLSASKHTGVRALFNRHFVKTGVIPKELATVFNDLFESRQEIDYQDFVRMTEQIVSPWIGEVERFINNNAGSLCVR